MKENQLALTSGIQVIVALPQITYEGKKDYDVANIENRFDAEDRQIMDKFKLICPSELMNVVDLEKYQEDAKKVQKQIPYVIGGLKKRKDQDGVEAKKKRKTKRKRNN